jgi:dihydroflavonol-4-reductase
VELEATVLPASVPGVNRMPVFVTGGSGFVGGAVVDHLLESGAKVRALARSAASAEALEARGAVPVRGDVEDRDSLLAGMSECDIVFHIAGVNAMCPADPGVMYRTNVDGVRTVVRAASSAGVRRIVLTSSAATIGEPEGTVASEATAHGAGFLSHYARSKYLGERAFFEEAARTGIEAVAVNPSSVQGPGRSGGSTFLLRFALNARRMIAVDTTLSIVDVDDAASAHLLAAEHGANGSRYLISGASITVREATAVLCEVIGRPIDPVILPRWAAVAAYPLAAVAGLIRGEHPICVEMLRTLLHGHRFDVTRSIDDLGMAYTPISETLRRTTEWLTSEGFIDR